MRVLHTSDWHLGRSLHNRKRYDEFESFLDWLATTIREERVDVLLVAGDVFDTTTPSNRAQELYYRFLCTVVTSHCRHVVVIAGNHDSPTFLNAPKTLLRALDVHVIAAVSESIEDELLVLNGTDGKPELIVCGVPYLRDRDIRAVEAGESTEDKGRKLVEGIRRHYGEIIGMAEACRAEHGGSIPLVTMGHLFTAGGETIDGDGVRELYVGSLAHVTAEIFPECVDYLALGHLHVPQRVNGSEVMRYSGSPLQMGFGEANQEKSVCLVEFDGRDAQVRQIPVPVFQRLERIRGDLPSIEARITELLAGKSTAWVEVEYTGDAVISDLRGSLDNAISGSGMEILRVRNNRIIERALGRIHEDETLDDLNEFDVFDRCLDAHKVSEDQRPVLQEAYRETVNALNADDIQAD